MFDIFMSNTFFIHHIEMIIKTLHKLTPEQKKELKKGVVEVEGKAMNRTALGVVAAIFKVYPNITFAELKEMLPDTLNPSAPKNYKSLFKPYTERLYGVVQPGTIRQECKDQDLDINASHFTEADETFKTSDGIEVLVSRTWESSDTESGNNDLQILVDHVAEYGIRVVSWESKKPFKRGEYSLEVINPTLIHQIQNPQKKSLLWLWILLAAAAGAAIYFLIKK